MRLARNGPSILSPTSLRGEKFCPRRSTPVVVCGPDTAPADHLPEQPRTFRRWSTRTGRPGELPGRSRKAAHGRRGAPHPRGVRGPRPSRPLVRVLGGVRPLCCCCAPPAIRHHSPRMRCRLRRRPSPADPLRRGDGASLVGTGLGLKQTAKL